MRFYRLTAVFYQDYQSCLEILNKQNRPYYVLLLTLDSITYAIPLRSHIRHRYCFLAGTKTSGLDYSKSVVIVDAAKYIDLSPVTIRQKEFNFLHKHEFLIQKQFARYVRQYKKDFLRHKHNSGLPLSALCQYSTLQYFHKELGL